MQTEFVRSLHANYERILLEGKPEEQRYQYCILNRGGIRGLLSCSLRYMNYIMISVPNRTLPSYMIENVLIGSGCAIFCGL